MLNEENTDADGKSKSIRYTMALGSASNIKNSELGGKALQLGALMKAGFPVPPGYCITTSTFGVFLESTGLAGEIAALDLTKREGFVAARERVLATQIPEAVQKPIRAAYEKLGRPLVAVRSSAVGEDSASHSFAGQHDTVLNVHGEDALLDAVRVCWASLWSDRAFAYRKMDGQAAGFEIAVVVQEMISGDAAGVIFTTDPVESNPEHLVLESCLGLGEGLVAGRVTTDSYVVHTKDRTLVSKQIRYKVTRTVAGDGEGGVKLEKVPHELRDRPSLDDAQALEIANCALAIRDHYGSEQDVEWVMRDGKFYVVQARPITTKPRVTARIDPHVGHPKPGIRERILWSRMDIGEIFTGMMTPMGISFAKYYQFHVHADCVGYLGLYELGDPSEYMGYAQGHVYLNVSYASWQLAQVPPGKDQQQFTVRFASEEVDLSKYENPYGQHPDVDLGKTTRYWAKGQVKELATAKRRADEMTLSRFAELDRFRALDLTKLSMAELQVEMTRDLEYFRQMHYKYMPYYINAFGFYGLLQKLCAAWMGEEGKELQNRLKGDMSNLRTIEGARAVWRLAQKAKESKEVEALVRTVAPEDAAAALRATPAGERFWQEAMEPFFHANGVRGRQEMEISYPRWIDDPSYVFQMIKNYVVNDFSIDDVLDRGREHRSTDTGALMSKLPPHKRALLKVIIKLYSSCSELREIARMAMITSIYLVRGVLYEVARRLVNEGLLRSLDEVAYLDFHDVLELLAGRAPARQLFTREKIEAQRRLHLHNLRSPEPPLTFIGSYDPKARPIHGFDGDAITGLAASPGRVVAKARVVHDLWRQADEFEPGEVLVTTFTDASWTPLFAIASGVVTDIGSMLSHSSIVSREFNIPSVVNTKVATQAIKTGDLLVVDGDNGVVQIQRGA